jgi:hypothetical protein
MVAYQGNLQFEAKGSGGIGRALKQALSGEGVPLMKVTGQGDLFLANAAQDVHLIDLDGSDGLTINGANVLAFESSLSYDIKRVQGAAAGGNAGFFNCVFSGRGRIAITTDGDRPASEAAKPPGERARESRPPETAKIESSKENVASEPNPLRPDPVPQVTPAAPPASAATAPDLSASAPATTSAVPPPVTATVPPGLPAPPISR